MAGWTRAATTCPKGNGPTTYILSWRRRSTCPVPCSSGCWCRVSRRTPPWPRSCPATWARLRWAAWQRCCLCASVSFWAGVGRQPGVQRGVGHGDHGGDLCPGALVRNGPGRDLPGFLFGLHAGSARLPGQGRAGVGRVVRAIVNSKELLSWLCQGHFSWPYGTTATH